MRIYRLAITALALTGALCAQVTSSLTGSVVDPSGAVVAGATVDVLLPGGAKPLLSMPTTSDGLFVFTGVPAGA